MKKRRRDTQTEPGETRRPRKPGETIEATRGVAAVPRLLSLMQRESSAGGLQRSAARQALQLQESRGNRHVRELVEDVTHVSSGTEPVKSTPTVVSRKPRPRPMQGSEWKPLMKEKLNDASTRALALANGIINQTDLASDKFKIFCQDRIADLEDEVRGSDLVDALVAVVPGTLTVKLADKVISEFGKSLIGEAGKLMESSVSSAIKDAAGLTASVKHLEYAIDRIPDASKTVAGVLPQLVSEKFDGRVEVIVNKINDDKRLSGDDALFARDFLFAETPADMDKAIEKVLGLPGPGLAIEYQVALYQSWVRTFSEMWLVARSTHQQKLEDFTASQIGDTGKTFKGQASNLAFDEAKKLREKLRQELSSRKGSD